MSNEAIEVRARGRALTLRVGGRKIPLSDSVRNSTAYTVLMVLAKHEGGRIVFNSAYELVSVLRRYIDTLNALIFVNEVLPDVPDDLRRTYALFGFGSGYVQPENASYTPIPRDVVNEVAKIRQLLDGAREFSMEWEEVAKLLEMRRNESRFIERDVLVPTILGFAYADKACIGTCGYGPVGVYVALRGTYYGRRFEVEKMTLGDLITLVNFVNALSRVDDTYIVKFARNAPQAPVELVNQYLVKDSRKIEYGEEQLYAVLLHQILGELEGERVLAPVIRRNGVVWRESKIRSEEIGGFTVYVTYRYGNYNGDITFIPGTNSNQYAEAMNEFLEKNPWLRERIENNAKELLAFLKKYEEYLIKFMEYAKLLL